MNARHAGSRPIRWLCRRSPALLLGTLVAAALLGGCGSSPAGFKASVATLRPSGGGAVLIVEIKVTNTGGSSATPHCLVTVKPPGGAKPVTERLSPPFQVPPGRAATFGAPVIVGSNASHISAGDLSLTCR